MSRSVKIAHDLFPFHTVYFCSNLEDQYFHNYGSCKKSSTEVSRVERKGLYLGINAQTERIISA